MSLALPLGDAGSGKSRIALVRVVNERTKGAPT
jgi:hypothetical protein